MRTSRFTGIDLIVRILSNQAIPLWSFT